MKMNDKNKPQYLTDLLPPDISPAVMDAREGGVMLRVWAKPCAKRDAMVGSKPDEKGQQWLVVSVKAVPEDGKANAALIVFLADFFEVKRSTIRLMQGDTNSKKLFFIEG